MDTLLSYSRAAGELGVSRHDVAVLVKMLGIAPKAIDYNARGKGLDAADMAAIRKALAKPPLSNLVRTGLKVV